MEAWLCRAPLGRTMIIEAAFSFTFCRSCSGVHEHVDSDYHHHDGDNDLFALFTTTGGTKAKVSSPPIPPLLSSLTTKLFADRVALLFSPLCAAHFNILRAGSEIAHRYFLSLLLPYRNICKTRK